MSTKFKVNKMNKHTSDKKQDGMRYYYIRWPVDVCKYMPEAIRPWGH